MDLEIFISNLILLQFTKNMGSEPSFNNFRRYTDRKNRIQIAISANYVFIDYKRHTDRFYEGYSTLTLENNTAFEKALNIIEGLMNADESSSIQS